jgi:Protein of unknown function (DUF4231)
VVGASIFATIDTQPEVWWKIAAGLLSLAAALLASLQTFFRFSEKYERHTVAGRKYADFRRRLDLYELRYKHCDKSLREKALDDLSVLSMEFTAVAHESPTLTDEIYDIAAKSARDEQNTRPQQTE